MNMMLLLGGITAKQWNEYIEEVTVVNRRNHYESRIGHFEMQFVLMLIHLKTLPTIKIN